MTHARRLYPMLFAAYPVIHLASGNPGYYALPEAAALCALVVLGVAACYALGYVLLRRRLPPDSAADVAALVVFGGVLLFYARWLVSTLAGPGIQNHEAVVAAAGAATAAVISVAAWGVRRRWPRRRASLSAMSAFLTTVGALVVAWSAGGVAVGQLRGALAVRRSPLTHELARPVPVRSAASGPLRDVYVIVLDEYAGSDVLWEIFHYDNRPFEDSLRALGFRIPSAYHSNYALTMLSVPSLLNFAHMRPLADAVGARSKNYAPAMYLIDHNRATRFLKARGYRSLFFPSSWFNPTRTSRAADEVYDPYPGFDLGRTVARSELIGTFASMTALRFATRYLRSGNAVQAEHAVRTFVGLRAVPRRAEPTFAVAHVLLPHAPFSVDAQCRPVETVSSVVAQIECVNREVLTTVRTILAHPGPRPIIIVTGDHGTETIPGDWRLYFERPTVEQARERLRPFGAFYLPDGGAAALPDTLGLVNVLRHVFAHYFAADLPALPETMYFSRWRRPYAMTELGTDFRARSGQATDR